MYAENEQQNPMSTLNSFQPLLHSVLNLDSSVRVTSAPKRCLVWGDYIYYYNEHYQSVSFEYPVMGGHQRFLWQNQFHKARDEITIDGGLLMYYKINYTLLRYQM